MIVTRNHVVKGRPIDVKKAISKTDMSKMKTLLSTGDVKVMNAGSTQATPPSNTPLPSALAIPGLSAALAAATPTAAGIINGGGLGNYFNVSF